MEPIRLTTAQAIIRFLINQYTERDGRQQPFFAGCFGIFGHGNVAGMGQAQTMPSSSTDQRYHACLFVRCGISSIFPALLPTSG